MEYQCALWSQVSLHEGVCGRCVCVCAHHMNYKTKLHRYFSQISSEQTTNSPIIDIPTFKNLIPLVVL